jgi:hypothetical protein
MGSVAPTWAQFPAKAFFVVKIILGHLAFFIHILQI